MPKFKSIPFTIFCFVLSFFGFLWVQEQPTINVFAPTEMEASKQGSQITIQLLDQEEEQQNSQAVDEWIKEFHLLYPQYHVARRTYPPGELQQKFTTAASAGQASDMVWAQNDLAGVFHKANLILPLNDWVDQTLFTHQIFETVTLDNKVYGIPISYGNHLMLLYNKKYVPKAPKDTDTLLKNVSDFQKKHKSKKQKDPHGLVFNLGDSFWLAPIIHGYGGTLLEGQKITLNTPAMTGALQFLYDLKFKYRATPGECDYECAKALFLEGSAPFIINGDWFLKEASKVLKDDLGVAPLPIISQTHIPMKPFLSGKFIFVNNDLKREKIPAIKKWLEFLTSDKIQKDLALRMGRLPALLTAQNSQEVLSIPHMKDVLAATKAGVPLPPFIHMHAIWGAMAPIQQKVLTGELKPSLAGPLMQRGAMDKLSSFER